MARETIEILRERVLLLERQNELLEHYIELCKQIEKYGHQRVELPSCLPPCPGIGVGDYPWRPYEVWA